MHVASLHIYPLKGARAVDLDRARIGVRGLAGDRRWLVVDETGRFMSQRSHPRLATVTALPAPEGLRLFAAGMPDLTVATPSGAQCCDVIVWDDRVSVAPAGPDADEWVSRIVGEPARLVHFDARSERFKRGIWVSNPLPISFADAYPVLIATTGSLAALNAEIARTGGAPVPMRRFRPNIVIDCDDPWAEDFWKAVRIGGVELELIKPDDRCIVTTTDQESGARMGKEPLASLARIRRSADPRINGVLFGWYAAPRGAGEMAVGNEVKVLAARPEGFATHTGRHAPEPG